MSPLVVVGLVLGACGGDQFRYVKSSGTDSYAFFKVPLDWARYNKKQLLIASDLTESQGAQAGFQFLEGFDGHPDPSIDHILGGIPDHPVVMAQVRELTRQTRDQISLGGIRNAVYPVDQLLEQDQADIIMLEDLVLDGGVHGSKLVYNLSLAGNLTVVAGNQVMRVAQIGLVDPGTNLLFLLVVRCTAECFSSNQPAIDQILNSYTVKEP